MTANLPEIRRLVETWCKEHEGIVAECWLAATTDSAYVYLLPAGADVLCRLEDEATGFERDVRLQGRLSLRITVCPPQHTKWLESEVLPRGAEKVFAA